MRLVSIRSWLLAPFVLAIWAAACLSNANQAAGAQGTGVGDQPPTPQPQEWLTPAGPLDPSNAAPPDSAARVALDETPAGPAETAGDPLFWTVFGLVVLGHLVLVAGFRDRQ